MKHDDLYRKMIEEIQDYAIIFLDINGNIQNWNKGAQKIKKYIENEILGKHFSIFYLQEDINKKLPETLLNEAKINGSAIHEGWRRRKDHTQFWGSITITAIHDDDNNIIGFCKVTRDLTDKKLADDKLRISEERYHQMIEEVEDYAIILLNSDGIIENWNAGAKKIKGYESEEIIGKSFELFYPTEDRENGLPSEILNEARTHGKASHQGWRIRKDGSKFWGTIVITAIHNKEGKVIGFSKVTRDYTQQKQIEEKLSAYTLELEKQNEELEQFAFVASHDLQEPLRKIQIFTELIQKNINDKEFVSKYFKKLDAAALRMSNLIKSLLDYSRFSNQKSDNIENVDLNEIVKNIEDDFELIIEDKKANINTQNLPTIHGNPIQMHQLFSNLISNALKFSSSTPIINITFSILNKEEIDGLSKSLLNQEYYKISVEDNGIGFEKEYSQLIFTLFQRLHGIQSEFSGTGIGLAICKKIVENHNGFIQAESEKDKGSIFTVFLPKI